MASSYMAKPRSIKDIRKVALLLRQTLKLEDVAKFPIIELIESMHTIDEEFYYEIVDKETMGNIHGLACPNEHCIKIREDVYERCIAGYGRDRFTLAHELGHYLLHSSEVTLARLGEERVQAYRDPEWQANTFAAELLMPIDLIDTNDIDEISNKFGVSYSAAKLRVKKINMH